MSPKHIVLSCKANWSHLRSLCPLAARIASSRAVVITILVANNKDVVDRVTREVTRSVNEETAADGSDIRIVGLPTEATNNALLDNSFRLTWQSLMREKPIQCAHRLLRVAAATKPSIVILDGFQLSWLDIIRSEPSPPPIFQWMMAFSGGLLYMCGPADLGGRAGQPVHSNAHFCDDQIQIPGMPPMTCRELYPQDVGDKAVKIQLAEVTMARFLEEADGLLTTCALEYDNKECLDSISDWVSRRNKRMAFHIGPMLPLIPGTQSFSAGAIEAEIAAISGQCGSAAMHFLDRAITSHGERSVFYISFGTEHWPSSTEQIQVLLVVLKQRGNPFVFSHAHQSAGIPDQMKIDFETSGQGVFLPFAPQQAVLAHKACGWFITHGGANGTIEAISQGIPMIGWPFAVDQPLNVAYMARTLDVAFELTTDVQSTSNILVEYEAQLGYVLDAARGEVGRRKRENAQRIGGKLALAWSKDAGRARQELSRFLDYYGF